MERRTMILFLLQHIHNREAASPSDEDQHKVHLYSASPGGWTTQRAHDSSTGQSILDSLVVQTVELLHEE